MTFKQQLTNISTVLNNTGNTTQLLTAFNSLDVAQQKVLLSSKLLTEEQKQQCIVMSALSSANTKYTAEQLAKATGISSETLATWGLTEATDSLTVSQLAEMASSDAQAKKVLEKIVAQNAQAVANGEVTASNMTLAASETGASLATGTFTTAIKANITAMWTWMTTTPLGWLTLLVGGIFAAVKAYDALTVSIEEQKEKMEESLSAYDDAKSELSSITEEFNKQQQAIDELNAKEKLTYAEKGQLEELQAITEELRIQKDLAEKEEKRTQKEVAQDASDLYKKQFGKYDISENAIKEYQNSSNITGNNAILSSDKNNISSMIAAYRQYNELLDEAYGSKNQEDIDHFITLTEELKNSIFDTANDLQEQKNNISDYYNTINDIPYNQLATDQKEIIDSYNAISDAIALIYKQLDPNTWNSMQIDNLFATDGIEKTKEELIQMAKEGALDESVIQSYTKLNSTLESSNIVLENGQSAASALCDEMYALAEAEKQVQESVTDKTDILSFSDAWSNLKSSTDDAIKTLADDLIKLAEAGQLTSEKLLELDSTGYFENLGISAEEAAKKINSMTDASTQLNALSDQIEKMSDMLADKKNGITASASDLVGFDAEVRGLDSWAEFEKVMGTTTSTMEECQAAANALATEWINNGNYLANLTEENKDYYQTQLSNMGIENAAAIVTDTLTAKKIAEKYAIEDLSNATRDEISVKYQEIAALVKEGEVSGITASALYDLIYQQTIFSNQNLDVYGKISALQELAVAFGITADAALGASQAINLENQLRLAKHYGGTDTNVEAYAAQLTSKMQDAIKAQFGSISTSISPSGSSSYKAPSSSSKSEKDTTKEFDWIENAIASLEKRIQSLQKVIDSSFSTTEAKTKALKDQIELINQEIELQQKAYDAYMAKAESVGLSDKYKNLIQNGDLNIEDITDEELQKAIDSYTEWYDKAQETLDKITDLREDNLQTYVDLYDLKADEINKIRDNGGMTEKEYLNEMTKLWKTFFNKQVDYAEIAKERKLDLLKDEKDYLESVVSAATNLLDDEIDSIEKAKDNATKGYKAEIEVLEDKIKVVEEQQEALENQISLIEEQRDAQQEILDNLEKERTKQNEILDVEQKRFNLKQAENQNKIKQYQDGQIVYTTDSNEIKNARQELDDAEFALTKRGILDVIDQYDKQIDNINKQIDGLDKVIDGYNKQIDALNDLIDKSDAYYDGQITNLENIKSEWEKLLEIEQRATDMKNFTDMFGEGSIAKLLTGDMSMLTQWKDTYASTLAEIDLITQDKIGSITEKFAELAGVDLSKVTSQFSDLNIAVENTSSAIDSTTAVGNDGQVSQAGNSLVDAMNESYNVASDKIPAEAELMNDLTDSVNETSSAIAGGGSSDGKDKKKSESSDSLVGAMDESYNKATDTIPAETDMMSELKDTTIQAKDEVVALGEEINNLPDEKVIKIKIETEGTVPNGFAKGTVGNAFAEGTKYKGLAHDEKNALRSEYGQPELTVYPNGKAELTTEPTMSDLPKDTVIYNEEQTKKIMNNKPESVSAAFEDGTVKKVGLPSYLRPIQEGDPWFDLVQKVEANRDKLVGTLVPPVTSIEKNMEMMARNINNVNNNMSRQNITIGDISVTCPGVNSKEVMDQVGVALRREIGGLALEALQEANITR